MKYLKTELKNVDIIFYDDTNFVKNIQIEYNNGSRFFILYLTSQQLIDTISFYEQYNDAYYICPISTANILRDCPTNLYFILASTDYLEFFKQDFVGYTKGLIYQNRQDVFVDEIIKIFEDTTEILDITNTSAVPAFLEKYQIIILASIQINSYNKLKPFFVANPELNYNIYATEIFPENSSLIPDNVVNLTVLFSKATIYPQINSYWNYLLSDGKFSYCSPSLGMLPILANVEENIHSHIKKLKKLNLITHKLKINGFLYTRYLKTYPELHIKFNNKNCHLEKIKLCRKYVWLIDKSQKLKFKKWNTNYIKKINPIIGDVYYTNDFVEYVLYYYKKGTRIFILDGPTSLVGSVQELNLNDAIFICSKSVADSIRMPGSNFFFLLCTDNTIIEEKITAVYKFTQGNMQMLLGKSNNSNIPEFALKLDQLQIPHIKINNFSEFLDTNIMIHSLGTESENDMLCKFIKRNLYQLDALIIYRKQQNYFTDTQLNILHTSNIRLESFLNYNTCQPYIDSCYTQHSIPPEQLLYTNFYDINSVLFSYDLYFLFRFGFIIDI